MAVITPDRLRILKAERDRRAILRDKYDWDKHARPEQTAPPGNWSFWLLLGGRGLGKTRTGSEKVRKWAKTNRYVNLIAATAEDARTIMIEGESGILAICPKDERPVYLSQKNELRWPNGAKSLIFTAEEPERLRGKQHEKLWADELAAWRYPEAWDQAKFGLRLGANPQALITTTPRPTKILRDIIADPATVLTTGTTYDNRANLAASFYSSIIRKYEGTRLGQQELDGKLLTDIAGALWSQGRIDELRVQVAPELSRIIVAIDPAVTSGEDADETGIVVVARGADGHGYVLADRTGRMSPGEWASCAVQLFRDYRADAVIAEANNGGDLVEANIRTADQNIPFRKVWASRGKVTRAEPVASLYEQCVVAGTLVATEHGERPIESIVPGDLVWTRDGLRAVEWSGCTGFKETVVITATDGRLLTCTPEHPVYILGKEFVHAGQLVPTKDTMVSCVQSAVARHLRRADAGHVLPSTGGKQVGSPRGNSSFLRECATSSRPMDIGGLAGIAGMSYCTGPYGGIVMAPSLPDFTSIIETATQAITSSTTWLRSIRRTISALSMECMRTLAGKSSSACLIRESYGGLTGSHILISVMSVGESISQHQHAQGSAHLLAIRPIGIKTVRPGSPSRVFNLQVQGKPEFFANGLLVHNCRFHHVGVFGALEDEMTSMTTDGKTGSASPNRADALVWGASELMIEGGTVTLFSEFRGEARPGEPANALHIATPQLQPWWYRWMSAAIGQEGKAVHWYCQEPDKRVNVYREKVWPASLTATQWGAEIARVAMLDHQEQGSFDLFMPEDIFDLAAGRSVAAQIAAGVTEVLGPDSTFLYEFTDDERHMEAAAALESCSRRRAQLKGRVINLRMGSADEVAMWQYLRESLRWKALTDAPDIALTRDQIVAMLALPDGNEQYMAHARKVDAWRTEVLPKLRFDPSCQQAITFLSTAMRDPKNPEVPLPTEQALVIGESLRCGMDGARNIQATMPKEVYVGARLDAARAANPDITGTSVQMIARDADHNWNAKNGATSFSFARTKRRRG